MKKQMPFRLIFCLIFLSFKVGLFSIELCQLDLEVGYRSYRTHHIWNKHGKKISTFNDFKFRECQIYLDTYLSSRDCLALSGSYIHIEDELNGTSRGFSDSELTWTHFIYMNESKSFSTQMTAIIPSGSQIYNLRYGEWGGQVDFLYSCFYPIYNQPVFFDSILGYRIYRGFPSDQIRGYFSAGTYILQKFYVEASLDLQYGVFNGRSKFNYPLFLLSPNYRLLQGDIRAVYHLHKNVYLSAGVFQHLWGQNVGTGTGYFLEGWLEY